MKMNNKLYQWLDECDGGWLALRVAVIAAALEGLLILFGVCRDLAHWVAIFAA